MLGVIQAVLSFFISISFNLIIYLVIFQFLLEYNGTNHHHPIRQQLLRYTQPLLDPIHRIIPDYHNFDIALLVVLFLLENLKMILLFTLKWQAPNLLLILLWSILLIINSFIDFYFLAILFRLLINFVLPIYSNHPATQILYILTEPVLRKVRHPALQRGKFDWTPVVALVALKLLSMMITFTLLLLGAPRFIL